MGQVLSCDGEESDLTASGAQHVYLQRITDENHDHLRLEVEEEIVVWGDGGLNKSRQMLDAHGQSHVLRWAGRMNAQLSGELARQLSSVAPAALEDMLAALRCPNSAEAAVSYEAPQVLNWDKEAETHVYPGHMTIREDVTATKLRHWRRLGVMAIRDSKVGVVLLAGGVNLRMGLTDPPVAVSDVGLPSKKSILGHLCQRLKRVLDICDKTSPEAQRPSVPLYVMTSEFTHRAVSRHFADHGFFGLDRNDVYFFEQGSSPVFSSDSGKIAMRTPHEIVRMPDGSGGFLKAMFSSSVFARMVDRGLDCLHVLTCDNVRLLVQRCASRRCASCWPRWWIRCFWAFAETWRLAAAAKWFVGTGHRRTATSSQ